MSNIDSDDEFIKCYKCEIEVEIIEVYFYNKFKVCKDCKELLEENDIAQPIIMIERFKCVRKPDGRVVSIDTTFAETNGMRKTRLQEEKKQKEEEEKAKQKKQVILAEKKQKEAQKLAEEKFAARLQQKEKWEGLTIGTKIAQLEVQICHVLHDKNSPNWNSYAGGGDGGRGQRVMLYENYRFKELQKTCPVIEQASRAIYNFTQPPHLQIENPFEKKDQIEKIHEILEKWLEEITQTNIVKLKVFQGMPPSI